MPYRSAGGPRKRPYGYYRKKGMRTFNRLGWSAVRAPVKSVRYVAKQVRKVKDMINAEMKQYTAETTMSAGGGQVTCLNPIDQGDGHANRDGLTVRNKYLQLNFTVFSNASQTDISQCRVAIVCKKNNAGAAPVYGDVYDTTGAQDYHSLRTINSARNFFVLREKQFTVNSVAAYNIPRMRKFSMYIPLDMRTRWEFGSSGGGAADIQTNGLYVLFYDNSASNFSTCAVTWRIGFYDN